MASPFRRLKVTHDVEGPTRVEWELTERFLDPEPHVFGLQVAATSAPGAADWADVGLQAENAFYLTDGEKREYGKTFEHRWRVLLETPTGSYASEVVGPEDNLSFRDWRLVREMLRQARKRVKKFSGVEGALLKLKRYGPPCPTCVDPRTRESNDSDCPDCYGTGLLRGYHAPVVGLWADMDNVAAREERDGLQNRGTVKDVTTQAAFPGFPYPSSKDVWAERESGQRWFVEKVTEASSVRGHPFLTAVELRLAPFSDPVYKIAVEWP